MQIQKDLNIADVKRKKEKQRWNFKMFSRNSQGDRKKQKNEKRITRK